LHINSESVFLQQLNIGINGWLGSNKELIIYNSGIQTIRLFSCDKLGIGLIVI